VGARRKTELIVRRERKESRRQLALEEPFEQRPRSCERIVGITESVAHEYPVPTRSFTALEQFGVVLDHDTIGL